MSGLVRVVKRANAHPEDPPRRLLLHHARRTSLVGDAVQESWPASSTGGANWIVKGENNVTNGALKLEMR